MKLLLLILALTFSGHSAAQECKFISIKWPFRYDTLNVVPADTFTYNKIHYKILLNKNHTSTLFPKIIYGCILVLTDGTGRIQNLSVTGYDFDFDKNGMILTVRSNYYFIHPAIIHITPSKGIDIYNLSYVDMDKVVHNEKIIRFRIVRVKK